MSHPFIAEVIRSIREAATSAEAVRALALRFHGQALFFPQASQAGAPEGKKGFRLIGESASDHEQGWWARRQRRVGPRQVVWLAIDTVGELAKV